MSDFLDGKKKFLVSVMASVLAFFAILYDFTPAEVALVVGPLTGYVIGQGMADNGKEATRQRMKMLIKAEDDSGDH